MTNYLDDENALLAQTVSLAAPPAEELFAATQTLSQSPVSSYPPFTKTEVRMVGIYRELLAPRALIGRTDDSWAAIVQAEWYAWIYAIHEISEINEFSRLGVNPFDNTEWNRYWQLPHLRATIIELQYLRTWAIQSGEDVPEPALLTEHPIRSLFPAAQTRDLHNAQREMGWPDPTAAEVQAAQRFWNKRGRS